MTDSTRGKVPSGVRAALVRFAIVLLNHVPRGAAAGALALARVLQGRRDEALAYAWLAGLLPTFPAVESEGHVTDFEREDYFTKFEDEIYDEYVNSNVILVERSVSDRYASICDIGCGRGFLIQALKDLGYRNIVGYDVSQRAVRERITEEVNLFLGFETIPDARFDVLCLISVLEHIDPHELGAFLDGATRITRDTIVCCIPTYPNNLFDFFRRDMTHRTLAGRRWWDAQFSSRGFTPLSVSHKGLPYIQPYAYQRRDLQVQP